MRNWLTFIAISWGAVQLGMGFVRNWYELVICRVLLGAFTVGVPPIFLSKILLSFLSGHFVPLDGLRHDDMVQAPRSPDTVCLPSGSNTTKYADNLLK